MVLLAEGTPKIVECPLDKNFILQPEDLERAITPKQNGLSLTAPLIRLVPGTLGTI